MLGEIADGLVELMCGDNDEDEVDVDGEPEFTNMLLPPYGGYSSNYPQVELEERAKRVP